MQSKHLIRCGLLLAIAAPLCAQAGPLGTKPGAWETTVTSTMSGMPKAAMPEISPEQLAQLPPERRARIEKMMKMQQGEPTTQTRKGCLKPTDTLEKLTAEDRPNCKKKVIAQTSTSLDMEMTCSGAHPSKIHMKVKALSSESVATTMDMEAEGGFKMHAEGKSHWVGSSCAGIDGE